MPIENQNFYLRCRGKWNKAGVFLQDRNIIINGFIVSDMEDNPEKQLGFTVISVVDFQKRR